LNWVTTLRTSRLMATRRGRVEQLDVELSWVGLLRYERGFNHEEIRWKSSKRWLIFNESLSWRTEQRTN